MCCKRPRRELVQMGDLDSTVDGSMEAFQDVICSVPIVTDAIWQEQLSASGYTISLHSKGVKKMNAWCSILRTYPAYYFFCLTSLLLWNYSGINQVGIL